MRRPTIVLAVLAALLPILIATPAQATDQPVGPRAAVAEEAVFEFTDVTRERFVFRLTDPGKIDHARRILNGEEDDRVHVVGRISKSSADYNSRWSYHLRPDTIDFFRDAIEVCDAYVPYVEDHLDEAGGAFLPRLVWCPWTSELTREITAD